LHNGVDAAATAGAFNVAGDKTRLERTLSDEFQPVSVS